MSNSAFYYHELVIFLYLQIIVIFNFDLQYCSKSIYYLQLYILFLKENIFLGRPLTSLHLDGPITVVGLCGWKKIESKLETRQYVS